MTTENQEWLGTFGIKVARAFAESLRMTGQEDNAAKAADVMASGLYKSEDAREAFISEVLEALK